MIVAMVPIVLPMALCLHCDTLQPHTELDFVAEHDLTFTGSSEEATPADPRCPGSGIAGSRLDGRDEVRRTAVLPRSAVNAQVQNLRTTIMNRSPLNLRIAVATDGPKLMPLEAQLTLWDQLLSTGCYVQTVQQAIWMSTLAAATPAPQLYTQAGYDGARKWLNTTLTEVLDVLKDQPDDSATARASVNALRSMVIKLTGPTG